jgi:hypothetical protein
MILIFQDYSRSLFPWRTVLKNVLFVLEKKNLSKKERLHLVVRLRSSPWQTSPSQRLVVRGAETGDMAKLLRLVPDAYWNANGSNGWKKCISEGNCHVLMTREDQKIVGAVNLPEVTKDSSSTELALNMKLGFGKAVLDTAVTLVKTRQVDVWLQDNHQDLIDYAYRRGLKRLDSEYLMRKPIGEKTR